MNNQKNTEDDTKILKEGIKEFNQRWYQNKVFFIISLILGPATFVGGYFIEFYTSWQAWVAAIVFLISAGFFVVLLSYLFNLLWIALLKEKEIEK